MNLGVIGDAALRRGIGDELDETRWEWVGGGGSTGVWDGGWAGFPWFGETTISFGLLNVCNLFLAWRPDGQTSDRETFVNQPR